MILYGGEVIMHEGKKKVVVCVYSPNDNLPYGRCSLMHEGQIEWHDSCFIDAKHARLVDEFPKFVEVSQHNYREKTERGGYSVYHKAPRDMYEAMSWAIDMGGIRFLDIEDCGWGRGLYRVLDDGSLEFVRGDWDSSG